MDGVWYMNGVLSYNTRHTFLEKLQTTDKNHIPAHFVLVAI